MGNGETIYPPQTKELHYEGELGIVIDKRTECFGSRCRPCIVGIHAQMMCHRKGDLQRLDGQWTRSKSLEPNSALWVQDCEKY